MLHGCGALALAALAAPLSAQAPAATAATMPARAVPAAGAPAAGKAEARTVQDLLSEAWLADAFSIARDQDVNTAGYEAVLDIAMRCAALTPDRRSAWEAVLLFADKCEAGNPDAAIAARRNALAQLARLDPADDVIRLSRIADAIDAHPTAEARVRAYEQVLDPQHRASIGGPVAARLAYQLASLESRIGNTELFSRWLSESVKADPAYPLAAQAAAGFFRMRVNDPASDIELLSVAAEANPRDLGTWTALLSVMLDGGAFAGAERVARLAIAVAEADMKGDAVYALTGDLSMALWGGGRREDAVHEIELRLSKLTDQYRAAVAAMDPTIPLARLNKEYPPVPASLSIAILSLQRGRVSADAYAALLTRALQGTDAEILRAKNNKLGEERIAELQVEKATLILLFGTDMTEVPGLLDAAAAAGVLGEQGRARYDAMLAGRSGRADEALRALEPMRANDTLARFGYAMALLDAKRPQEAAVEFRTIAAGQVGKSIGLLALDRLAETLGQKSVLTSQVSPDHAARAQQLERVLSEQLPKTVDDIVEHPLRALAFRAEPVATTVGPYEPVSFRISLRNASRLPMAIGPDCPIGSRIIMRADAPRAGTVESVGIPPQPLSIDRRLRLAPGEEMTLTIDAAITDLGRLLSVDAAHTHLVSAEFLTNPIDTPFGQVPGFLGGVTQVPPIQVLAPAPTADWLAKSRATIKDPAAPDRAVTLALLCGLAAVPAELPEAVRADVPAIWDEAAAAWKSMPPLEQAWIVSTLPKDTPAMAPMLDAMRASTDPDVLTSWLIGRVTDPIDPMIDVARRTNDPRLAKVAAGCAWVADRRNKRAIEAMGASTDGGKGKKPADGSPRP